MTSVPDQTTNPTCPQCGGDLPAKKKTGPSPTYCSKTCRNAGSYARRREAVNAEKRAATATRNTPRPCPECGETFKPSTARQKFCSRPCMMRNRNRRAAETNPPCTKPGCERVQRARGLCNPHLKQADREAGTFKQEPWNERRRENYHRRLDQIHATKTGTINKLEVFERDGWICGICAEPVDPDREYPDRMSASMDHVVPLALGGQHTWDNVQCSHLHCNIEKGKQLLETAA